MTQVNKRKHAANKNKLLPRLGFHCQVANTCFVKNSPFCGNSQGNSPRSAGSDKTEDCIFPRFLYSTIQCTIFQYFTIFQSYNLSRSLFTIYCYSQSLQTVISYIYRIVSIYVPFSEVHTPLRVSETNAIKMFVTS